MTRDTSAYRQVVVESFIPSTSTGKPSLVQLRPIHGQAFSSTLLVQCSRRLADTARFPLGTQFLLLAKMTDRLGGTPFYMRTTVIWILLSRMRKRQHSYPNSNEAVSDFREFEIMEVGTGIILDN